MLERDAIDSTRPEVGPRTFVCLLCRKEGAAEFICAKDGCVVRADGTLFAKAYLLQQKMASGGWGTVYKCEHVFLKKTVAIKILHSHMLAEKNSLLRFQREARILSSLNHENVVALSDHGWIPRPFIAMEYLEGRLLSELISEGPIPPPKAISLFKQICCALEAAHNAGVIHRDLKPANLAHGKF